MGRRRGGGGGTFRRPAKKAARKPAQSSKGAAAPAPGGGGGLLSGLMGTVAQGMAFGTGSAVAHRAVGAVAGGVGGGEQQQPEEVGGDANYQQQQLQQQSFGMCDLDQKQLYECLQTNNGNAAMYYFDALKSCQMGGGSSQMGGAF